jgi:hypothetical protein
VEAYEITPARAPHGTPKPAAAPTEALATGDQAKIVKNALAGTKYPPEWLEQYLGRTGKVLWTTAGGAMVELDHEATWFPYAELASSR